MFAIFFEDNGRCLVLREGNCHCRYFSNVCHPSWLYRRIWISFQLFDIPYKRKFALELKFCYLDSWLFHSILIMFIIWLLQIFTFLYYWNWKFWLIHSGCLIEFPVSYHTVECSWNGIDFILKFCTWSSPTSMFFDVQSIPKENIDKSMTFSTQRKPAILVQNNHRHVM